MKMKAWMVQHNCGRIVLHVGCMLRGGKVSFHWAGIRREIGTIVKLRH